MLIEPLTPSDAKRLIIEILNNGTVDITPHAFTEMGKDRITVDLVYAVLRGGVVEPAEFERGTWRYRVRRSRLYVVAFDSETRTVVVTAWRKKP